MENQGYEEDSSLRAAIASLQLPQPLGVSDKLQTASYPDPSASTCCDPASDSKESRRDEQTSHIYEDIVASGAAEENPGIGLGLPENLEKNSSNFRRSYAARQSDGKERGSSSERSARRRRKKDCKHCSKSKANASQDPQDPQGPRANGDLAGISRELRLALEPPSFLLSDDRVPNFRKMSSERESVRSNGSSVFSIFQQDCDSHGGIAPESKGVASYEKNEYETRTTPVAEAYEEKALITPQKIRGVGMRVNSIYSQDHWRSKDVPIFLTDVKEQSPIQRAYSLPVRAHTPTSQNRVNLRRSVRGEPPPHPARLHKHRHGWTLHFSRPLEGSKGCTRSIVLLLIIIFALLGIGAIALYIVFEPEKLQVIQQYLKSSAGNTTEKVNSSSGATILGGLDINENNGSSSNASNAIMGILTKATITGSITPASIFKAEMKTDEVSLDDGNDNIMNFNLTRYCDDCRKNEVCVALVDDLVPTCRTGPDPTDPTGCAGLCLINKQKCHRLDVDAFRCMEVEHYCLDDEWMCTNTLCIPVDKRCDGHMNCYDYSDEYNCVCNPKTHFQCGNETSCLPMERKCDGRIDCWDATDEMNCTLGLNLNSSCPLESEFTCSSGQCILKTRFCDGLRDCEDGTDEPKGCQGRCNKHEFTCRNKRCIPKEFKCNGKDDCGDGTDEQHCRDRIT